MVKKKKSDNRESVLAKKAKRKISSYEQKIDSKISQGIDSIDQHLQSANTWIEKNKGKIVLGTFLAGVLAGLRLRSKK